MFLLRQIRRIRHHAQRARYRNCRHLDTSGARGRRLLRDWLSISQRKQFDTNEYFDVIGCDTGRTYRIYYGRVMNVPELDEAGRPILGWCFLPKGCLVAGDVILAQKIALEAFEVDALKVALTFPLRRQTKVFTSGSGDGQPRFLSE
jgi:hypothetical protein